MLLVSGCCRYSLALCVPAENVYSAQLLLDCVGGLTFLACAFAVDGFLL